MPIMTWDQTLDVGIEEMNRDHRKILDTMNHIFDTHSNGPRGEHIIRDNRRGTGCAPPFRRRGTGYGRNGFSGTEIP